MLQDQHGLAVSTSSADAAASLDHTILAYLKYRTDTSQHLARTLAADPEFGLAHCLAGYFAMLSYKLANVSVAAEAARTARSVMRKATARTGSLGGAGCLDCRRYRPHSDDLGRNCQRTPDGHTRLPARSLQQFLAWST